MYRYILCGKVIPERVDFSISMPDLLVKMPDAELEFNMRLSIQKSQISVEVLSEKEIMDIETLRNYVVDLVTLHTDVFGYINGYGYDIEITSLMRENNKPHIFGVGVPALEEDRINRPYKEVGEILLLIYSNSKQNLRLALLDLRLAIKLPKDTPFFCYRAIESLMQYFNKHDKNKAWDEFRSALNISEDYIKIGIKPLADNIRHGKSPFVSAAARDDILTKTWKIIDRFIVYAKNNEVPLDKSEYIELVLEQDFRTGSKMLGKSR